MSYGLVMRKTLPLGESTQDATRSFLVSRSNMREEVCVNETFLELIGKQELYTPREVSTYLTNNLALPIAFPLRCHNAQGLQLGLFPHVYPVSHPASSSLPNRYARDSTRLLRTSFCSLSVTHRCRVLYPDGAVFTRR